MPLDQIRSRESNKRLQAARELVNLPRNDEIRSALSRCLYDGSRYVRLVAAEALILEETYVNESVIAICSLLQTSFYKVNAEAMAVLLRILPILSQTAKIDGQARLTLADALIRHGLEPDLAVRNLVSVLDDKLIYVRHRAMSLLKAQPTDKVIPYLTNAIKRTDPLPRPQTVLALLELTHSSTLAICMLRLNHIDMAERVGIIENTIRRGEYPSSMFRRKPRSVEDALRTVSQKENPALLEEANKMLEWLRQRDTLLRATQRPPPIVEVKELLRPAYGSQAESTPTILLRASMQPSKNSNAENITIWQRIKRLLGL